MSYTPQSPNNIMIPDYYTQYNVGITTQPLVQQMGPINAYTEPTPYSPTSAPPKYNVPVPPNMTMGQFQGSNTQYSQYSPYPPHATSAASPITYTPTSPQAQQYGASPAQLYNSQAAMGSAPSPNAPPQMMINPLLRTVYIGNLPNGTTYEELLNHVRGGKLDNAKIFEDKNYAFVTFVEASSAVAFYQSATLRRITIHNQDAKIGWGKPVQISPNILLAVQNNASRNIFIGNLDETITHEYLEKEFSQFGPIDVIKVLPEKRIAFVHMTSIAAAMKAIQTFQNEKRWIDHRINYGNDRCALPVKLKSNSNSNALLFNNNGLPYSQYGNNSMNSYPSLLQITSNTANNYPNLYSSSFQTVILNSNPSFNRTVYLGGFGPDITIKDICDVIRGGILQEIKYKSEGNCAFVTFVDPNTATSFYNKVSCEGIIIKGKRINKVGWGKHPTLSQYLSTAIQNGATRNVYIGQLEDGTTEEKLRNDFSEFGDIELINLIPEKKYGFVNFTSIKAAVKAVESMKNNPEYQDQKISYGKDRCGNPVHERSSHSDYFNYKMPNGNNHTNISGLNTSKPMGNENEEPSYKSVIQQA